MLRTPDSKLPLAPRIIDLDEKIKQAEKDGNRELKKDLKHQSVCTPIYIKIIQLKLILFVDRKEILLIEGRNLHVKNGLQNAYSETFKNAILNVFCVSNTWYEKYRQKERSETTLKLVATSGIPGLRRFCYLLCAQSRLEEAKHFIRHTLASIISSIGVHSKPESFSPAKSSTNSLARVEGIKSSVWN